MKKILFTIQWYNIDPTISNSANTICDENIINELKKNPTFEIHTLSYAVDGCPLEDFKDGVYIHRFKRSWLWRQLINSRKRETLHKLIYLIQRILMRVKQVLTISIYPIYDPFLVMKFARHAYSLHKKEKFDMVISVHYGTDSLYAGYYLKKKCPEIQYIAICWDSIAGGNLVNYLPKTYALSKKRNFEFKINTLTDAMIVMEASKECHLNNPKAIKYLKKLIFLDVPYFCPISTSEEEEIQTIGPPLKVMFSGNMVGRDPSYLLHLLEEYPDPVIFTFICHDKFHKRLYLLGKEYRNVIVKCFSYMKHDDLLKIQLKNDVLVNFGVKNPNAISGKIFDYMSTGKAILSTTTIDNEACIKYLEKYPKGLIIDERLPIENNKVLFLDFITKIRENKTSFSAINKLFYTCKPEAYKTTIETIISKKNVE